MTGETTTRRHGGPGRKQGRKPITEGERTLSTTLRMTERQRDKLSRLGGAGWVRKRIDEAPEPMETFEGTTDEHE